LKFIEVGMKVLHLIPHLDQGGAERLLVELCDRASADFTHVVVTMFDRVFFRPRAAVVHCIDFPRDTVPVHLFAAASAIRRLRAIVSHERPDLVHTWLYYGNILACSFRDLVPKILWSIHNTNLKPGTSNWRLLVANRMSQLLSGRMPDQIIYCAEAARSLHEAYGYAPDRATVVHNGVDVARFRPDPELRHEIRRRHGVPDDCFVVGCFARFDSQKNFPLLFEAIARARSALEPMRVLMAGKGLSPANGDFMALVEAHGLQDCIVLPGAVTDVAGYMNAVDAVTLASSYGEALPLSLMEAAACERAIVTTQVGDVANIGIPKHCLIELGRVDDFSAALETEARSWRNGGSHERLAAVARHVRQAFSIDGCVERYETVYRRAAGPCASRTQR
jgi:glycosyltransferase involved in cell wall biosynthesis